MAQLLFSPSVDFFNSLASKFRNTLTPDQADKLALSVQGGCIEDKGLLLLAHLYLIPSLAKRYDPFLLEDLYQDGVLGIEAAIRTFSPERGHFATHAWSWVRYYLQKALAQYGFVISVSEEEQKRLSKVRKAKARYLQENEFEASDEEIAERTHFDLQEVRRLSRMSEDAVDASLTEDETGYNPVLATLYADEQPDDELNNSGVVEFINSALCADNREAYIFRSFYGIGCPQKNIKTLAEELQLTDQRVRQLRKSAIKKLSDALLSPSNSKFRSQYFAA